MIIDQLGASFEHNGVSYVIGAEVIATDKSAFNGLYGKIKEIRTGADKVTDGETPDIYCDFDPPVRYDETEALVKALTSFSCEQRYMDDIAFDRVSMEPEMIWLVPTSEECYRLPFFQVEEELTIDDQKYYSVWQFTDLSTARLHFHDRLVEAHNSVWLKRWRMSKLFRVVEQLDLYECYLDGGEDARRFHLRLEQALLYVGPNQLRRLCEVSTGMTQRSDFKCVAEQHPGNGDLTDEQYANMLKDPEIPDLINAKLQANAQYQEVYWSCVNEAVDEMIQKYRNEDEGIGNNEEDKGK